MTETRLSPADFRRVVELNAGLDVVVEDAERRAALRAVAEAVEALVPRGARAVAEGLPRAVGAAMKPHGWLWNGFYVARTDELAGASAREAALLHVGRACGPPVCTPLERHGGLLSSGMCFDALALNQTLVAYDAKSWPGYVSCDATSGLATVSSIVAPVRGPRGEPLAVWDLDATERVQPGDVRFVDVLFATLAACVDFAPEDLA